MSLDLVVITLQTSASEQVWTCMGLRNNHAASTGVRTQRLQVNADAVNTTKHIAEGETREALAHTRAALCSLLASCLLVQQRIAIQCTTRQ